MARFGVDGLAGPDFLPSSRSDLYVGYYYLWVYLSDLFNGAVVFRLVFPDRVTKIAGRDWRRKPSRLG